MATLRELIIKISANSQSFQSEITRASRMGSDYYKTMQSGGRQAAAASRESQRALAEVNAQLASVKSSAAGVAGALAGAFATSHLIDLADQWNMVNARLKQASVSTQDFTSNQSALMALSQRTGTAFTDNAGLFSRSAASLREYGYSSQDALKVTEALATGLKLSGAGVQESSSVITQFSQALAQGVLRGEEFNSVNENGDRVIRALAAGMGVARKDLKAMADDGKLTADKVVPALISQLSAMQREFEAMPSTVGGSVTKVQNAFQQWVGGVNDTSRVTSTLAGTLDALAGSIDDVATAAGVLVAVGAARYFGNMASSAYSATGQIINLRKEQISAAAAQLNAAQMVQRKAVADAEAAISAYNLAVAEANVAKGSNASMIATQNLTNKRTAMIAANAALINSNGAVSASEASVNKLTSVSGLAANGIKSLGSMLGGIPGIVMLGATAWYAVYQQQEQARLSALQYADTIDQVRDSLKSMSLTQVNANLGRSSLSLDVQDKDISAQKNKIAELSNQLYNARQAAKNASEGTWLYNDATKKAAMYASQLADEEGKLEQMQNRRKQTQSLIDDLTQQSISKTVEMSGAVRSLADMYERLNKVTRQTTMFSHPQYAGPVLPKLDDKQQSAITKQQRERILSGLKDIERARRQAGFEADDLNLSGGWRQKYISDAEAKFRNDEANKPKKKGPKTDEEKAIDSYERLIKQQREQLALDSQSTEFAKIKYQTSKGELSTLSDIQKTELLRNATSLDYLKTQEKFKELQKELLTPEEALLAKTRERVALLKQAAPATEQYRDAMERISKASITEAPKFNGIDASVGGPSGEILKVADAQKELEKWHKKQLEMQKELLKTQEGYEEEYAKRVVEINQTKNQRMQDLQAGYTSASLGMFSDLAGQSAALLQTMGKEGGAAYKALFIASKAAAIAQAVINTEVAATKAMAEGGLIFGMPAATVIRAVGYASVGLIAGQTIAGMAHDGIDRVPETGTWLLQKGERVVTAQTSAKLDSTLESVQQQKQEDRESIANGFNYSPTIQVNGNPDDRTIMMMQNAVKQGAKEGYQMVVNHLSSGQGQVSKALGNGWGTSRRKR